MNAMAMDIDSEDLFGLEVSIDNVQEASMDSGDDAFIFYLKIFNKTSKSRNIKVLMASYVTHEREQLEQNVWLTGYILGEANLKAHAYKNAGLVFYKSRLKSVNDRDVIYIIIELLNEGRELTLCYQKMGINWNLIDRTTADIEIKLTAKQLQKDILKKIERLEAFEERLGVHFDHLSIEVNDSFNEWAYLHGEIHSDNGSTIDKNIHIIGVIYDTTGLIIDQKNHYIDCNKFYGFEVFTLSFQQDGIASKIGKIRIFPKIY